jgi:hypothetical protein
MVAEKALTSPGRLRFHVAAGLTTFVVAVAILSLGPGMSSTAADTVGTAIGVLFLSSLFLAVTVVMVMLMRYLRRGRDNAVPAPVTPPVIPQQAVSPPAVPVCRATAPVPEPLPTAARVDTREQTAEVLPPIAGHTAGTDRARESDGEAPYRGRPER